jgi:hypothetical protein
MAKVQVQIAVSSVSQNGEYRGRVINGWESYSIKVKGELVNKKRQWTMWLELPSNINKDDIVTFNGELGSKTGTFDKDGQTYNVVEHFINDASYTINQSAVPIPAKSITELTSEPPF